jgi:tetratricopeptide (TPR) repeat protein
MLSAQKLSKKDQKLLKEEQTLRQAEEFFVEGNKDFILGRFDKAIDYLIRACKLKPENAAFNYKLADCYAQQNNNEKAVLYAQKAHTIDAKNRFYGILLAQLYERTKKYKEAIKVYEKIVDNHNGSDELLLNIANLQVFTNDFSGALKTYNKLEELYGLNEEIIRQKQLLFLKQNKLDEAILEWKKLIASNPEDPNLVVDLANLLFVNNRNAEAKKLLEETISKHPDSPYANLMLSEIYKKEGKNKEAKLELQKAFESPNLNIDAKIGVLISMIRQIQADTSINSDLISLGNTLVKVHPNEAKSYAMNGDILAIQEKKQLALSNYIKSITLDNSHFKIWQQIIFLGSELNQNDTIIKYAEKAIEVFPTQPIFYYYAGSAFHHKKNYVKAIEQYSTGKKITINNNELVVQFLSQLGDSFNELKNYTKSDSSYDEALTLDPENVHVLNNYSYYLSLRKEKLEKAKKMCETMLNKNPNEAAYLDTYGWVLYQLKDYENAKKYIEKALLKTNDATIIEHYGDILFQIGDKTNALIQWKKAKNGDGYSDLLDKKIEGKQLYE